MYKKSGEHNRTSILVSYEKYVMTDLNKMLNTDKEVIYRSVHTAKKCRHVNI